jgi:hypothetical protein
MTEQWQIKGDKRVRFGDADGSSNELQLGQGNSGDGREGKTEVEIHASQYRCRKLLKTVMGLEVEA